MIKGIRTRLSIRKKIGKAIKIFLTLWLCFIFLEQASRFLLFGLGSFNYFKINSVHPLGVSGLIKASPYREIIYELKPNLNTYFKMARFKTNSQGLRDREYTIKKPQGTFRVVVLGDSFTMPAGVAIEDAFHTILENRFNKESPYVSYEFINFGVGGYDPIQYLATLKNRALAYSPDLVLFCLCEPFDDIFYPEERYRTLYNVKPRTHPFFESFLIRLFNSSKIYHFLKIKPKKISPKNSEIQYGKLRNVYVELKAISETRNIPICIVILINRYCDQENIKKSKELASQYGLYFVDTSARFKNTNLNEYKIYPIDNHSNAKANKIFAEVIYNYLTEQGLLENNDI